YTIISFRSLLLLLRSPVPTLWSCLFFFFYCYLAHRDLHSFPTRRSSDLFCFIGQQADFLPALVLQVVVDLGGNAQVAWNVQMIVDRKSTRLNSSHGSISYAVFCLKKKKNNKKDN